MALVQRPVKQGGSTTYQGKVAQGFTKILSAEADADLDTIYAAWNGGADTVNISDGAVTSAKLAPGTLLWQVSGATLTPTDTTKNLTIPGNPATVATVLLGTQTAKGRLQASTQPSTAGIVGLFSNRDWSTNAQDDPTRPSWGLWLDPTNDHTIVQRSPPGSTTQTVLLTLDYAGNATVAGNVSSNGGILNLALPAGQRSAITGWASNGNAVLDLTANVGQAQAARPVWMIRLNTDAADNCTVWRTAPNAGTQTVPLSLDSAGNLVVQGAISTGSSSSAPAYPSSIRVWGSGQGVRFQNTGTLGTDGYSSAIAFGYASPNITARVDSSNVGTVNVTPPSDERFKQEVREDVHGLATICALRPVSFEYRQEMREVGFPVGRRPGLIAQEAQAHVPFCIEDDGSDEHYLGLDYRALVPVLVAAVRELAAKMATLEGRPA